MPLLVTQVWLSPATVLLTVHRATTATTSNRRPNVSVARWPNARVANYSCTEPSYEPECAPLNYTTPAAASCCSFSSALGQQSRSEVRHLPERLSLPCASRCWSAVEACLAAFLLFHHRDTGGANATVAINRTGSSTSDAMTAIVAVVLYATVLGWLGATRCWPTPTGQRDPRRSCQWRQVRRRTRRLAQPRG